MPKYHRTDSNNPSFFQKKAPFRTLFFCPARGFRLLAVVLLIVRFAADLPEVGTHGLFAIGEVFLSCESQLVSRHLREVDCTLFYGEGYCRETRTSLNVSADKGTYKK